MDHRPTPHRNPDTASTPETHQGLLCVCPTHCTLSSLAGKTASSPGSPGTLSHGLCETAVAPGSPGSRGWGTCSPGLWRWGHWLTSSLENGDRVQLEYWGRGLSYLGVRDACLPTSSSGHGLAPQRTPSLVPEGGPSHEAPASNPEGASFLSDGAWLPNLPFKAQGQNPQHICKPSTGQCSPLRVPTLPRHLLSPTQAGLLGPAGKV